jgi:hypothetical protein
MTLQAVVCPLCRWGGKVHGYEKSGVVRGHIRAAHPEVEAEIRAFEREFREKRAALREKYGKDFLLVI